jgi:ribokinase
MVISVPSLPVPGQTITGDHFSSFPGGKGANQAVAAARAGARVKFITAVGDDLNGRANLERLAADGIDVGSVITKPGSPSGVALILVDGSGENIIAVAPGSNGMLTPDDLAECRSAFSDADLLLVQLEIPLECVIWAVREARQADCRVLLNPAPMPPSGLPDDLLAMIDFLVPNETEVMALAPHATTVDEAARMVLDSGVGAVIVTQGGRGVTVCTADEVSHVPAFPVEAVDTVGAGDCFCGSLGVALGEGLNLDQAVRFACVSAALSTTARGAQEGMPHRRQIDAAMV